MYTVAWATEWIRNAHIRSFKLLHSLNDKMYLRYDSVSMYVCAAGRQHIQHMNAGCNRQAAPIAQCI